MPSKLGWLHYVAIIGIAMAIAVAVVFLLRAFGLPGNLAGPFTGAVVGGLMATWWRKRLKDREGAPPSP